MSNFSEILPCEVNARVKCIECRLHNNGCPVEAVSGVKTAYDIVKAINPVQTTPKAGTDVKELIKAKYPDYYKYFNTNFEWIDLDGILDFLYFHAKILHVKEAQQIIDLIESNCKVTYGKG